MVQYQWNTPSDLRKLLCELVSWDSRTLTEGERAFSSKLEWKMKSIPYFEQHPELVEHTDAGLGRYTVTALYKHPQATKTIVLISHFDTVWTEEYGALEPLAFHPEELTEKLKEHKDELPVDALADLESGQFLFGRGTMDMKAGLAAHMALIEKASNEQWPINLLLLSVPDEEVNSSGMRAAVTKLIQLRDEHRLVYTLFLNGEPTFSQTPGDAKEYLYTGTLGKIMPAALFYGKETHVGEPLKGMTANYIASFLTQHMEWNQAFEETDYGEATPLPVSLQQKDLTQNYSAKTPYRAAALYNVFLQKRNAREVMELFQAVANEAINACNEAYERVCQREGVEGVGSIRVLLYEELLDYAIGKLGPVEVDSIKKDAVDQTEGDDREKSFRIVDALLIACQELAPAVVLFYAPPYYPAVNTSEDPLIQRSVEVMKRTAQSLGARLEQIHYFNGICDLSYLHYKDEASGRQAFAKNTPVWGETYSIPFEEMTQLDAPVLNVGPYGKDAHQRTERLHIESAFVRLPILLETLVKSIMADENS